VEVNDYAALLAQLGPSAEDKAAARQQAIMRAGMGILSASGPSRLPTGLGGILAQGGMQGMDTYNTDLQRLTNERKTQALMAAQLGKMQKEGEQQKHVETFAKTLPEADRQRFLIDPSAYLRATAPKPQEAYTLAPGAIRFGPDGKPIASAPTAPPAPRQPQVIQTADGFMTVGPDGRAVPLIGPRGPVRPQAPATPRQQQVIQTAEGPMILGDDGAARPITGPTGAPVKPSQGRVGPMTATAQKELIETEEGIQGGQAALALFKQARALNEKAMGFTGAGSLASAGSLLPGFLRPEAVDATQNLDNILQTAALPQLKAIFGGMPTEGERKILLDVQGSSSKPPAVRKEIFDRAEKAIQARLKFGTEKVNRLREGTYFSGEGLPSIQPQNQPDAVQAGVPAGVDPALWQIMTPEEKAAFAQ
jgi:hypothetical protein